MSSSNPITSSESSAAVEPQLSLEYAALKSAAGLRVLDDRLMIRVIGDDRVSFMHGMCSADIKGLAPGMLAAALFLTEHAHVVADSFIYATGDDALLLEVERSQWSRLRAHVEKLLIADDVEFEELEFLAVLDVEGPSSAEIVDRIFGSGLGALEQWHHQEQAHFRIANLPRFGGPAWTVIGERSTLAALAGQIKDSNPQVCDLTAASLEVIRIENGFARTGVDTDERTLAVEARLERAISFRKGCYLGQETIERATARGALKRRLFGVFISGDRIPAPGASIMLAGKVVGRLTSVAYSSAAGAIGLAILHHSAWPPGTLVSLTDEDGTVDGRVSDLPFSASRLENGDQC